MRSACKAALVAGVAALMVLVDARAAQAKDKNEVLVDIDVGAMWVATVPSLSIGGSSRVTFNSLSGLRTAQTEGVWFERFAFDMRASTETWYLSVFGLAFAAPTGSSGQDYAFDGGTVSLGSLSYAEIMLPGGGVNLGDHVSLGVRPFVPILGASGSATNGQLTIGVGAGTGGLGVQGELSACIGDHAGICLLAQPMAMIMAEPDVGFTAGVRVAL